MILYLGNKLSGHGFSPTSVELLGPRLSRLGFKVVSRSSSRNQALRLADMMLAILMYRSKNPVVLIDTYSTAAFWFAVVCGKLCAWVGLNYIPILRGGELPSRLDKSPGSAAGLFGKSFTNVAVSGYMEAEFKKRGYRVVTIHNNIDLTLYPFELREKINPRLLWVRSFHQIYNPLMAIQVLEKITKKFPGASLAMVGPVKDGSFEECRQLAAETKLDVTFTGLLSKEEWIRLSKEFGIFINTTNVDNTPVSVMEAMALGIPVVSTNAGGVPFLINNASDGYLVNTNDVPGMAAAIEHLLLNPGITAAISLAARKKALEWDWDVQAAKWKQLLEEATQKK